MEQETENLITTAIDIVGVLVIAEQCGVVRQAVKKWERFGLPDTDYSEKTSYSKTIQRATNNKITADELLQWSKEFKKNLTKKQ